MHNVVNEYVILLLFFIFFLLKIWLKMTYFYSFSVQKYPFWVNVQIENLLSQFVQYIDQIIAYIVKFIEFQLDTLLRTFKRRAMRFFVDYKVISVVFEDFKNFGGKIL